MEVEKNGSNGCLVVVQEEFYIENDDSNEYGIWWIRFSDP